MYKILVVDDEPGIRDIIKKYAVFEGHQVTEAVDGMNAIDLCRQQEFDIIILDIMMPELDGFSTCKEIRKTRQTPVIMLSARGEEYDKIHGFELGIDDYVVKPFSPKELMLRVQAVMNRSQGTRATGQDVLSFPGLIIDLPAHLIYVDGQKVDLTPKEFDLLFYLAKNNGLAMTREKLLQEVWDYDLYGDDRTLDTHIKLLRKNLGPYNHYIVTLRGVGYRFEA
jgi:DNA-binding response OmpR family regulator